MSVTRLTVLKSLCRQPDLANRFVAHLARLTHNHLDKEEGRSAHPSTPTEQSHRRMMDDALDGMAAWRRSATEQLRRTLSELLGRMQAVQDEHRNVPFGAVRLITDPNLLLVEYALECHLAAERAVGTWAYQTARQYAERYEPSRGTGLIPASLPFVQDMVEFWVTEYALTAESLTPTPKAAEKPGNPPTKSSSQAEFTPRQGQFLAFIHLYRKLHRRGPAEADLRAFFRVTPPSVHDMIVKLEGLGLITREPGVTRSVRIAVPAEQLPELDEVTGPPW